MTAAPVPRTIPERLAAVATGVSAAFVLVAIVVLPFLTPAWVSFEQGRAQAAAWTGFSDAELSFATNAILHDLVLGPPDFAVEVGGTPVLAERERAHMRDVRTVFAGFFALAGLAAIALLALVAGARRMGHPERAWAAISAGMRGLIGFVVILGVIATVAFDQLFETFHELFFPAGSFTFDPRTDRLVQLFPFDFWSETTIVLGGVIVVAAGVLAVLTGRLARAGAQARGTAPLSRVAAGVSSESAR